ncbi:MAG: aldo/keto reductase, partial [Acidobacteria bacterium]
MNRRDFMKGAAAMSLISSFGPPSGAQNNNSNKNNKDIPQRPLGRTGVQVSVIGLGGSHIGGPDLTD